VLVGGITYRVFARQQLGEIAFCAVSAVEQVKGYGTRLMDKLKGCVERSRACACVPLAAHVSLMPCLVLFVRSLCLAQVCDEGGERDAPHHICGQQRGGLLPKAGACIAMSTAHTHYEHRVRVMLGACILPSATPSALNVRSRASQGFSKEILMEREKWAGYIKARPALRQITLSRMLSSPAHTSLR
jgi:hypothetical protein